MKKSDLILNTAVAVMACCAVLVTALLVRREFFAPASASTSFEPTRVRNWERFAEPATYIGPADAAVTVIEFSDFQCPYCKQHTEMLQRLRARYGDRLSIAFRHYPLSSIHPHAEDAALAAECASEQQRFEAYHDLLFASQDSIGQRSWTSLAEAADVPDMERFEGCMRDRIPAARIAADRKAGDDLGVAATPTSIVNGMKMVGALDESVFTSAIDEALRRAERRR